MAKNETPQPLTREEFEAGVEFYYSPDLGPYDDLDSYKKKPSGFIVDKYGRQICRLLGIEDDGFMIIHFVFHEKIEAKILFSQCFNSKK